MRSTPQEAQAAAEAWLTAQEIPFGDRTCVVEPDGDDFVVTYPPPRGTRGGDFRIRVAPDGTLVDIVIER